MPAMNNNPLSKLRWRFAITLGLHGSASTWMYNVVRDMMAAAVGADHVVGIFAETARQVLQEQRAIGRFLVCKTHLADREFDMLVQLARPAALLTVRDPRDAAVSFMQRFRVSFDSIAKAMPAECARVIRYADAGYPLFRYEDRFFDDPRTLDAIGRHLGLALPASSTDAIFERYRTDSVRQFAASLESLPQERLARGPNDILDAVTQIHRGHIGDGRTGKWREHLDSDAQAWLNQHCGKFLERFGYGHESPGG
jgi:hypothetical protein